MYSGCLCVVGQSVRCRVGVVGDEVEVEASFMLNEVEHLKSVEPRCAFLE